MRMQRASIVPVLLLLVVVGCSGGGPAGDPSLIQEVQGADSDNDTGDGPDGHEPDGGGPPSDAAPPCEPGATTCIDGRLATCDGLWGWLLESCPEGQECVEGACVAELCEPYATVCSEDGGVQVCGPSGEGYSAPFPCPEGTACQGGICLPAACEPGEATCVQDAAARCNADGTGWEVTPCAPEEACFDGVCIACVDDPDCGEGLACIGGACVAPPLEIVSPVLPDGKVGVGYEAALEAQGGLPPYEWVLVTGSLPDGLTLEASGGAVSGVPSLAGTFPFILGVQDTGGGLDTQACEVTIHPPEEALIITTGSPLPSGEEGTPYQAQIEASGGEEPYFFGVAGGALPAGLSLGSGGLISGTPAEHGTFAFTVKAFDNGAPPAVGQKDFELTLEIAPLEIIADTIYDLWVVKIVVLPLITVVEGIPIPYSVQLQAKGGVKPYHWEETDISGMVSWLIPNAGLPEGLSLEEDGQLHGAVTDPSQVVELTIPFTGISLTGFFFMGRVTDSQDPADEDSGLFLAPTLPVSF